MLTVSADGKSLDMVVVEEKLPGIKYCSHGKNQGFTNRFQSDMPLERYSIGNGKTHKNKTSSFLSEGYALLNPIQDTDVLFNRQNVVREFIQYPELMQRCGDLLNVLSLSRQYLSARTDNSLFERDVKTTKVFAGALNATQMLLAEFESHGGMFANL
ncbi:MAG: hypothetical protein Q7K43_00945, partial [Candidatus Woesearchaeota archaeon]|nr:hypothetical protein [Candidatus Woesearchaeota archaeon]